MKKYQLVDIDKVLSESNSLSQIESEKEKIVDEMIDANKCFLSLNIFERIEKNKDIDFDKVILLKPDSYLPVVTHEEYDSEITLEKDEVWFGLVS